MLLSEKLVVFRVDAAHHIGTGHLQRCLTLANELQANGYKILFVMIPFEMEFIKLVERKGFSVLLMSNPCEQNFDVAISLEWLGRTQEDDAYEFLSLVKDINIFLCIIDHYSIDITWEKIVKKKVRKIFVIDDLANRRHECNILLDQNYWNNYLTRYDDKINNDCIKLLGPQYCLLRNEFSVLRNKPNNRIKGKHPHILINFGGVGNCDLLSKFSSVLCSFKEDYDFTVVTGKLSKEEFLYTKEQYRSSGATVIETTSNMASLMADSEYSFGACGSTVWERFCLGLNSGLIEVAENQKELLHFLSNRSLVDYVGRASTVTSEQIYDFLNYLDLDSMEYKSRKERIMALVDGLGANKVVSQIKGLEGVKGKLRRVESQDRDMIFEWRNRDEIRKNMYHHELIDYATHKKWFESILNNTTNIYFIYEQENQPLGLVSFNDIDKENKVASWAFYSANLSIRGLGSEMERLALKYAFEELNLNKLCCEVLDFNFPVVRFHQKHGFKLEGIKRQQYKRDDVYYDIYQLAILKKDYEKISKNQFKASIDKKYSWDFVIDDAKIDQFAEQSGDKNPIHICDESAQSLGFKQRIAHGAILISEISKVAASDYPGPNTIYLGQDVCYLAPVYPNMKVTGRASLVTQIGRYCLIRFELFHNDNLLVTSDSEFLLGK